MDYLPAFSRVSRVSRFQLRFLGSTQTIHTFIRDQPQIVFMEKPTEFFRFQKVLLQVFLMAAIHHVFEFVQVFRPFEAVEKLDAGEYKVAAIPDMAEVK